MRQSRHDVLNGLGTGPIDQGYPRSLRLQGRRPRRWTPNRNRTTIPPAMWSAAMDVGEWLKRIGLGQYEAHFREHEIGAEVELGLIEADLEKFGVPFGHHNRLSKAIAKLGNAAPEQPEAAPPLPAARSPPQRAFRPDAERPVARRSSASCARAGNGTERRGPARGQRTRHRQVAPRRSRPRCYATPKRVIPWKCITSDISWRSARRSI
jgi:hypothetical protein